MHMLKTFFATFTNGLKAFREGFITTRPNVSDEYLQFESRRVRYDMAWASYENTQYRDLHQWAMAFKKQFKLYAHIRSIYNPSFRIAEFYKTSVWRGIVDADAGEKGAIPITLTAGTKETIRKSIAHLFVDSNMPRLKDILVLWGAVLGDVGVKIIDDTTAKRVYFELIHPSMIKDVKKDSRGFVKSYTISYKTTVDGVQYTFTETATRTVYGVLFETFKDDVPFGWNGNPASWSEYYEFVPFIHIAHNDVGLDFGWSETHPIRSKLIELDDLASKVHDQIRKLVDPVWLFNFGPPRKDVLIKSHVAAKAEENRPTQDMNRPLEKDETPAIYVKDTQARGQALVANVNVADMLLALDKLIKEIEADFPELQMDLWNTADTASGKALHIAREKVEAKILARRAAYDTSMVRLIQMALAIGGERRYAGYEGLSMQSFSKGELNFSISARPIFPQNAAEKATVKSKVWASIAAAAAYGIEPRSVLIDYGYSEEEILAINAQLKVVEPTANASVTP